MKRRILYIQYTNPAAYPPLQHSSHILARAGWNVAFLGVTSPWTRDLVFPPHEGIKTTLMSFMGGGTLQKLHYLAFSLWILLWCLFRRPQWVYASDPLSCVPTWIVSWLPGIKVLYHEHDSPGEPGSRFMRMIADVRKGLALRAETIVLPNERRCDIFAEQTGVPREKVQCVWNCPSMDEISGSATDWNGGDFWLYYHGNISEKLLPYSILEAMSVLPDFVKLRAVGYETIGSQGYVDSLLSRAVELGLRDRLEIIGPVPRRELFGFIRKSHLGLCFMPRDTDDVNMQAMVGASNKVFDYLACGVPVLLSDLPEWKATYVDSGVGLCCDPADPTSVCVALKVFIEQPELVSIMGSRGRSLVVKKWNYESQFHQIEMMICSED